MKHLSEKERRRRAEPFLQSVIAIMPVREVPQQETQRERSLAEESLLLLMEAAKHPMKTLTQLYEGANADGRALEDLRARQMVFKHALVRKRRSGQAYVLEVLKAGWEELEKEHGIARRKPLLRGSFMHEVYARYVGQYLEEQGQRVSYGKWFGGKEFDVFAEGEDAIRCYEIVLSGAAEWNASQLIKAASVKGVASVTVVCKSARLRNEIKKRLRELECDNDVKRKIHSALLADFM